ncbi:MAG: peptidase S41 [Micavibrio sp.]|nr:peptidase S41 [Micavibrio sp.]
MPIKNFLLLLFATALIMSGMGYSTFAQETRTAGTQPTQQQEENDFSDTYKQLNLFGDVFERVRAQYVDEITDKDLVETAINGMLTSLDPHSSYLNEENFSDMQVRTRGEFGGLGIEVTMENGLVKVVSPIDDTPAFRAGIQAGDYIIQIDEEAVMGLTLSDAVEKMRGKVGTDIDLVIRRESEADPIDITITRDVIRIRSVRHHVEQDKIGYIRITTFNQNTEEGVKEAVNDIKNQLGNKLVGYVLDLRNNPGGLLDQAIAVSDAFLDKGEIVSTRGRNASDTKRDNATSGDIADGLPIVVLINGGSASASEIVSGALQDHKRAILLGTKTFGKGSVQTVIPLPGHGAMRLTTARYYTPSGRSIQAKGIEPDIIVEPAKIETLAVRRFSESDLRGALDKNKGADSETKTSKDKDGADAKVSKEDDAPVDYQLLRAIDLISGLSLYKGSESER